jgi:RNA polymerase sigma-70 factor, ECF subfamily
MAAARDERALVRGAQRGSVSDLEALFRLHWDRAYRAAYLVVHDAPAAEDIAQEEFLAAVRALDRFDRSRPFGAWLHRIVVNRAIDAARARTLRGESVVAEELVAAVAVETSSGVTFGSALRRAAGERRLWRRPAAG